MIVLAGVFLCGLAAARGVVRSAQAATATTNRRLAPVGWMALGIVLNVVLLERIGFVIAAAMLFWLTARAFDARHPARDALFALIVSIAAYVLFARVLQLQLPSGILPW